MSALLIPLALVLAAPLAFTGPAHRVSSPASTDPDPVSTLALTADDRERPAEWVALMTERYAPDAAHGTTDDHAVRCALRAAAQTRR